MSIQNPQGPSTQIVGFQGPTTFRSMDFGDLKPFYLGTWTLSGAQALVGESYELLEVQGCCTHRLHSSSFLWFMFRILSGNPPKGTTMEPMGKGYGVLGFRVRGFWCVLSEFPCQQHI